MIKFYLKLKIAFLTGNGATLAGSEKRLTGLKFITPNVLKLQVRSWLDRHFYKNNNTDISAAKKIDDKLMFVFQGRNGNYAGIGQTLYKKNKIFRETIKKCHNVCINKFALDLVGIFENKNIDLKNASELEVFVALACIQCSLSDFYRSKNILPEAIVAMSLGEAAAGYAAGAYSLEDAVSIAFYIFDTCTHMEEECTLFTMNLSKNDLAHLIEESAGTLIHFAEFTLTKRVLICSNKNIKAVSDVLKKNKITCAQLQYHGSYHTPYSIDSINKAKDNILSKFGSINYLPLTTRFHTCLYEKAFPTGSRLNAAFWVYMLTQPVLFGRVITDSISSGFNMFLNIGGHPKLSKDIESCANDLNKQVTIFDSFRMDAQELPLIYKTVKDLKANSNRAIQTARHLPQKESDASSGFMSATFFQDPYPYYEVFRRNSPVQYWATQNYWLVSNYADVDYALKNPQIFSSIPARGLDAILLGAEPLDHARARKLMAPFFKNTAISALSAFIESTAASLLKNIQHTDFDIVSEYAIPLTESAIGHLIGLDLAESTDLQNKIGRNKYELTYIPILKDFFATHLTKFTNSGDGSFCARLLHDEKEKGFSVEELNSILKLLWVAGTTTTSMLISSSVLILLSQPDIEADLRSDFSKIPLFIEEVLRFESPEQTCWRTTTDDVQISGVPIPKNSEVRLCLGSANRDSLVFDLPNEFQANRNAKKHLAFAAGPHYCLGAELARLEARIAIQMLLKTFPALSLKTSVDKIEYLNSDHFRALKLLTVGI